MTPGYKPRRFGPLGVPALHDNSAIGLLGGSFNPAHDGHREISIAALETFNLDAVWWLVSPGNPLKDPAQYAPYQERLAQARKAARHPKIVISDFENRKCLQYTVDTLETLKDLWQNVRFVWLMGADSLNSFHHWKDWSRISELAPMAVFNRPGHENAPESAPAAKELAPFRVEPENAVTILENAPPAWTFIPSTENSISSTKLRSKK